MVVHHQPPFNHPKRSSDLDVISPLSQDSRASKVLVDLEARIVEAQAKVEETQQGTARALGLRESAEALVHLWFAFETNLKRVTFCFRGVLHKYLIFDRITLNQKKTVLE